MSKQAAHIYTFEIAWLQEIQTLIGGTLPYLIPDTENNASSSHEKHGSKESSIIELKKMTIIIAKFPYFCPGVGTASNELIS